MTGRDQDDGTVTRVYRALRRIRRTEEEIARLYPSDKIRSPVHLSIGQESVAVGVCDALRPDDVASATYRCHATYLAKGGDLKAMMAELYGKATGCAGGKAGSMHLIDIAHGVLGASAVVGTTVAISVGYALALKQYFDRHIGRYRICTLHFYRAFGADHRIGRLVVVGKGGPDVCRTTVSIFQRCFGLYVDPRLFVDL